MSPVPNSNKYDRGRMPPIPPESSVHALKGREHFLMGRKLQLRDNLFCHLFRDGKDANKRSVALVEELVSIEAEIKSLSLKIRQVEAAHRAVNRTLRALEILERDLEELRK